MICCLGELSLNAFGLLFLQYLSIKFTASISSLPGLTVPPDLAKRSHKVARAGRRGRPSINDLAKLHLPTSVSMLRLLHLGAARSDAHIELMDPNLDEVLPTIKPSADITMLTPRALNSGSNPWYLPPSLANFQPKRSNKPSMDERAEDVVTEGSTVG
eukprot:260551-Amphidinium_carterae.1